MEKNQNNTHWEDKMTELVVFTFDVPKEKQAEYLMATTEKIKPFWESHGCQAYEVWQTADGEPAFMKTMLYTNTDARQRGLEGDAEAKSIVQLFSSFVTNLSRKTYTKKP